MSAPINGYCQAIRDGKLSDVHQVYHATEYGFPIQDDNELFGRFILEINQAGLSWTTILNKQHNFRQAYAGFDIESVANFTEEDRQRLLQDAGIIRNKLKVNAAIHNAQVIVGLQQEFGSFKVWLDHHHPLLKDEWVKLFKRHFKFTGGEITNEFLMSSGYLPDCHDELCPVYHQLLEHKPAPAWIASRAQNA